MEAICSSETSVETQQTTRCHIPEDDTLNNILIISLFPLITGAVFAITRIAGFVQ
jgi:positive regulator of sigma E activity